MFKTFSKSDVASHNTPKDLYIIIDDDVYDLTAFQEEHPGTPAFYVPKAIVSCV